MCSYLPARLHDTGQFALQRFLSEADTAQTEATHVSTRAAAQLAAVADAHFILSAAFFYDH
jgi:hypothetical protein